MFVNFTTFYLNHLLADENKFYVCICEYLIIIFSINIFYNQCGLIKKENVLKYLTLEIFQLLMYYFYFMIFYTLNCLRHRLQGL